MRVGKMLTVLVVLLFTAASSMAAGFRLPEQGAKAMGMGMAFTAQADDPSAIYYNPAGIVQLEGQNVMIGGTYIRENGADFSGTTPLTFNAGVFDTESETQEDLDFVIPNAYWTRKAAPDFAYGVGIFAPFGLGQKYEYRATSIFRNQVTNVEIQTVVVNPTVAWKLNDVLSVGAGVDFMYGKAKLSQAGVANVGTPLNIFQLDLDGHGTAWGYNFGLLLTPSENVKIGAAFRSSFRLDIKDANVNLWGIDSTVPFVPNPVPPPTALSAAQVFGGSTYHTSASTTINMPATFQLGVAYILDRLTLEVDLDWTFWSAFKTLKIDIENNNALLPDANRPENWKDVVGLDVGAEYRVTDPLALRLGFRYDPSPVPADTLSPLLPDADRFFYCAGAGYKFRNWTFDLSYMYLDKKDRTVNNQTPNGVPFPVNYGAGFNGTWSGDAHLLAFDIGYKF
jgi:long-chain fatty acid transport protein